MNWSLMLIGLSDISKKRLYQAFVFNLTLLTFTSNTVLITDALGAGESIEFAYKLDCQAIQLAGIPEHLTPKLKKKPESPA